MAPSCWPTSFRLVLGREERHSPLWIKTCLSLVTGVNFDVFTFIEIGAFWPVKYVFTYVILCTICTEYIVKVLGARDLSSFHFFFLVYRPHIYLVSVFLSYRLITAVVLIPSLNRFLSPGSALFSPPYLLSVSGYRPSQLAMLSLLHSSSSADRLPSMLFRPFVPFSVVSRHVLCIPLGRQGPHRLRSSL